MRRNHRPARPDPRQPWQIAQAAKCACRGSDDYCPCQNVDFSQPTENQKLAESLRRGLAAMATYANVPMDLWDRFSNDVLRAADQLAALARADSRQ